jgi:60 kDa SS-A/Ro ribonucleoprotein
MEKSMRLNMAPKLPHGITHEGAAAARMTNEQALRRSVMSCLLFEKEFYEDGEDIADRIVRLASTLPASKVAALAIEVREKGHLRHAPVLLLSVLAKIGGGHPIVADTIERVIKRADELAEFLVIHAKVNGVSPKAVKKTLSAQMKKGLARAFLKFDEYALAKYDRAGSVRLRDVLFMVHAKPKDAEQEALWKRLIDGTLAIPMTWETILSGALAKGLSKKEAWEQVIDLWILHANAPMKIRNHLAILRNLRNVIEAGVSEKHLDKIKRALTSPEWAQGSRRILHFRYIAAARAAPQFEPALDQALSAAIDDLPTFSGETAILVDVSGSMMAPLSAKSDMLRMEVAAALAALWPGVRRVFTFSNTVVEVPARRGMAGVDVIIRSQGHGGTALGDAVRFINTAIPHDRLVVITDEQSHDRVENPLCDNAIMINVASNQRGVGYGQWTHIDGFSENVFRFIHSMEEKL